MSDTRAVRLGEVLRDVARGGISGLVAGIVVGGLGGRLVMLVIAQLNRDAFGQLTEADAIIGRFTIEGTLALIIFGGLSAGLAASALWVVVSPWVPWSGARRWLATMPVAVSLGAFILVESTNIDFQIVGPTGLVLALLLGLVALTGAATAWLDARLERRLPHVRADARRLLVLYAVVAVLGAPALLFAVLAFFSESFSRAPTPPGVGWALLAVGSATLVLWARRIAWDDATPPRALLIAGRLALLAAVTLGALHLAAEVGRIYAAA